MERKPDLSIQAEENGTELDLNAFFPYQLRRTYAAVSEMLRAVYHEKFDLSSAEWRVLAILVRDRKITNREIVAAATIDKVTVSRAVGKLEDKKLVERHPNPQDGRSELLSPSAKGLDLYKAMSPDLTALEERILGVLNAPERKSLMTALSKLEESAKRRD